MSEEEIKKELYGKLTKIGKYKILINIRKRGCFNFLDSFLPDDIEFYNDKSVEIRAKNKILILENGKVIKEQDENYILERDDCQITISFL